ncbi:MAG: NIPSNAP family protein [Tepidiformaceae bacterium]
MFYELRQYRARPGQREALARYMEEVIIPFQIAKGMVVSGSFTGETEEDLYVWIRRFESEAEREALYIAVYQADEWKTEFGPKIGTLLDREKIVVTRLEPMAKSVLR